MGIRCCTITREIWYSMTGDGCGAANIHWFETEEEAKNYFEKENEGLCDICVGKLTISSDSNIHIMEVDA